jgi:GT2 family glycosyltransferase
MSYSADKRSCLVAICHNSPVVFTKTAQSLMELGWGDRIPLAKAATGFDAIDFMWVHNFPRVDALRDSAAAYALQEGFTHILFLDADMVWPTDVLQRMLVHHDQGIVGGLYVLKHPPHAPVAMGERFRPEGSQVDQFYHVNPMGTELIPCEVLGMGCTLIPVEVFRNIGPRPWFVYKDDDHGWPVITEDVPFCLKAIEAGYPVSLDPTIKCGHVGATVYDVRHHHRYQEIAQRTMDTMPIKFVPIEPEQRVGEEVV